MYDNANKKKTKEVHPFATECFVNLSNTLHEIKIVVVVVVVVVVVLTYAEIITWCCIVKIIVRFFSKGRKNKTQLYKDKLQPKFAPLDGNTL